MSVHGLIRSSKYPSTFCSDRCPVNPLAASGPQAVERGVIHHVALVRSAQSASSDLDIVIMGDSITEHLNGTGLQGAKRLPEAYREIFRSFFTKEGGGTLTGLALGGGGDTVRDAVRNRRRHPPMMVPYSQSLHSAVSKFAVAFAEWYASRLFEAKDLAAPGGNE